MFWLFLLPDETLEKSQFPGIHYLDSLERAVIVSLEVCVPVRTTWVHFRGQLCLQPVLYKDRCSSALPGHGMIQSGGGNRPDVSQVHFVVPLFLFLFFFFSFPLPPSGLPPLHPLGSLGY